MLLLLLLLTGLDSVTGLGLITALKQLAAGQPQAATSNTLPPSAIDQAEQGIPLQAADPPTTPLAKPQHQRS
jgi:hypothetical protein